MAHQNILADWHITYKYFRFKTLGKGSMRLDRKLSLSIIHCLHCYCTASLIMLLLLFYTATNTRLQEKNVLTTIKNSRDTLIISIHPPSPCPSGWPGCWHCRPPGPRVASAPGEAPPGADDHWCGGCDDQSRGYLTIWNMACMTLKH